ncbi:class I SAM-dependent methyltransferase [Pontibacter ruber]|uniref:Class I SAM-dependent methyltransferase n=1 Tax=Pontibacter ruber TaxID=1343895 RepID=A0ABW5D2R1_9BACT|nr:class I SAM-dependent methyltransferase [Pontibacter ruber]
MKELKDNFSQQADQYARYRPHYPQELYEFLYSHTAVFDKAWDCGTGNGQVAAQLANRFAKVYATDISESQLNHATRLPNIQYLLSRAEQTVLQNKSINLITVGQAFHWFDAEAFYKEVRRVATSDALLALWLYDLLRIEAREIDELLDAFYNHTLAGYWDPERKLIDKHYANIPFPFEEIKAPVFYMEYEWTLQDVGLYLNTWSAVQRYIRQHGQSPVDVLMPHLLDVWGDPEARKKVSFPIYMRVGKVN